LPSPRFCGGIVNLARRWLHGKVAKKARIRGHWVPVVRGGRDFGFWVAVVKLAGLKVLTAEKTEKLALLHLLFLLFLWFRWSDLLL
jgi:hypothetical protein